MEGQAFRMELRLLEYDHTVGHTYGMSITERVTVTLSAELVEGIDQVLRIIPDRAAWRFLDERSPYIDGEERPIDEYSTRVNRPMMLVDLRGSACVELGAPTDAARSAPAPSRAGDAHP